MSRQALIVEDELQTGEALAVILRRRSFEPTLLLEGKPALPWVREHRPELVLLDLSLPDIDGNDICEEIKLDRDLNPTPIIMLTGRCRAEDQVRGLQVGANYYLTKPFSVEQLDRAIREVLAWRDNLQHRGTEGEVRFKLQSDTRYLEDLNQLLAALLFHTCLEPRQVRQLTIAVREMGTNAIEWGHHKQVNRIVTVTYRIEPGKVTIVVRDTGPGFDRGNLAHAAKEDDLFSHMDVRQQRGLRDGGFGLMMTHGLVDEMRYNDTGNEVTLVKHCPPLCETGPQSSGPSQPGDPPGGP